MKTPRTTDQARRIKGRKDGPTLRAPPRDACETVFTRAQVEWALSKLDDPKRRTASNQFKTRVKHLLEFDRAATAREPAAFSDDRPEGRGDHGWFSAFDTVCLAIGLELIRLGFKRKDVVLLLRELRPLLRKNIGPGVTARLKSWPHWEMSEADNETMLSDTSFTLIVRSVTSHPIAGQTKLCKGHAETFKAIDAMLGHSLVLVSLVSSMLFLPQYLMAAPAARRGRGLA